MNNHLFTVMLQGWEDIFHCSFNQHTSNHPKASSVRVNFSQCIHNSAIII